MLNNLPPVTEAIRVFSLMNQVKYVSLSFILAATQYVQTYM